jgi:hypothetical protein
MFVVATTYDPLRVLKLFRCEDKKLVKLLDVATTYDPLRVLKRISAAMTCPCCTYDPPLPVDGCNHLRPIEGTETYSLFRAAH